MAPRLVSINVLMELIIAAAAVAKGFSSYFSSLILQIDILTKHPVVNLHPPQTNADLFRVFTTGASGEPIILDFMAMAVVIVVTLLLIWGVKQSSWVESACTTMCILAILMSIIAGK
jgi:amino acid transporter